MSRSSCSRCSSAPARLRRRAASSTTAHRVGPSGRGEDGLAAHPQLDAALDLGRVGVHELGDGARVAPGLQQSGDELQLVGADHRRGLLHAEVGLEPGGQQVGVAVPPAGGVGPADEGEELGALVRVDHAVAGEQVGDVTFLEPDAAQLQAADLGGRPADGVARLFAGEARDLALVPQPRAQPDAQHRGAVGLHARDGAIAGLVGPDVADDVHPCSRPMVTTSGVRRAWRSGSLCRGLQVRATHSAWARPARSSNSPLRTPAMNAAISARV